MGIADSLVGLFQPDLKRYYSEVFLDNTFT